jgi:hypothetical protein
VARSIRAHASGCALVAIVGVSEVAVSRFVAAGVCL